MLRCAVLLGGTFAFIASIFIYQATTSYAVVSTSPNYQLDESSIGAGGLNQSSSENYRASNSTNELAVGSAASENYQIDAGSQTTPDPTLTFTIDSLDVNFGKFSASTAATTTATFSVTNHTSYGYVVQVVGTPPTNGDHSIAAMTQTGDPQTGIEQFGINIVANTLPTSVGANPENGEFGFGEASPNYGTSNKYRFNSGETVALAPKSSGKTIYTLSYLVNVDNLTPGGTYTSNQTLIVTGTY